MNASTALRTARLWLRARLHREQRTDWIEYSKQIAWRRTPRLLPPPQAQPPSTYEPPQKTTDPAQQVHQLVETGRITSMIRTEKLPSVKGLHKAHFKKMPPEPGGKANKWLNDEPIEPEDEDATEKYRALTQLKHESRGRAS